MNWISVKDKLPDAGQLVPVFTERKEYGFAVMHHTYDNSATYWSGHSHKGHYVGAVGKWDAGYVTHWMPLPEPPKP